MADYSFSSAAMRKRRSKAKAPGRGSHQEEEEDEDLGGSDSIPAPRRPVHSPSAPASSSTTANRPHNNSKGHSKRVGGSSVQSANSRSQSKDLIDLGQLNSSDGPLPMVSSSDSSNSTEGGSGHPLTTPEQFLTTQSSPQQKQQRQLPLSKNEKRKSPLHSSGTYPLSSDDSEESDEKSGSSDDSTLASSKKTIDRYRHKYLDKSNEKDIGDTFKQRVTKALGENFLDILDNDNKSSDDNSDIVMNAEDKTKTYDKYRKQFHDSKGTGDKQWSNPKKKLGAPPSLEYNYRYSATPPPPPPELLKSTAPTPSTKPKANKVKLQSKKIDKDDLGILESMLGGDDSDAESADSSSRGVFSDSSEEGNIFVDNHSSESGSDRAPQQRQMNITVNQVSKESGLNKPDSFTTNDIPVSTMAKVPKSSIPAATQTNAVLRPASNGRYGEESSSDSQSSTSSEKYLAKPAGTSQPRRPPPPPPPPPQEQHSVGSSSSSESKESPLPMSSIVQTAKPVSRYVTTTPSTENEISKLSESDSESESSPLGPTTTKMTSETVGNFEESFGKVSVESKSVSSRAINMLGQIVTTEIGMGESSDLEDHDGFIMAQEETQHVEEKPPSVRKTTLLHQKKENSEWSSGTGSSRRKVPSKGGTSSKGSTHSLSSRSSNSSKSLSNSNEPSGALNSIAKKPDSPKTMEIPPVPQHDSDSEEEEEEESLGGFLDNGSVAVSQTGTSISSEKVAKSKMKGEGNKREVGGSNAENESVNRGANAANVTTKTSPARNETQGPKSSGETSSKSRPTAPKYQNNVVPATFKQEEVPAKSHVQDKVNVLKPQPTSVPPAIREDELEESLADFLDNQSSSILPSTRMSIVSEPSNENDDDDFSDIWARSVATESKERTTSSLQSDSYGTEELPYAASRPTMQSIKTTAIREEPETSDSRKTNDSSPASSKRPAALHSQKKTSNNFQKSGAANVMIDSSDSESDSDGSIDFDKLTGLEQLTMGDSKGSSSRMDQKPTTQSAPPAKMSSVTPAKSGQIMQRKRAESSDSDSDSSESLNALEIGPGRNARSSKSMNNNTKDDESISEFSLMASKDLMEDGSLSKYQKPEYEPQRSKNQLDLMTSTDLNQGFNGLDASDLEDIEAPKEAASVASKESSKSATSEESKRLNQPVEEKKPIFVTGIVRHIGRALAGLSILAAIGLSIYFLAFQEDNGASRRPADVALFPTPPTVAPTDIPPSPAPMQTAEPTPLPVNTVTQSPTIDRRVTNAPTRSRISVLRDFLISVWPSLADDLIGFTSPQYLALDWLANNANFDSYSRDKALQRFALATLFFSTNGDEWRQNTLWLSDEEECMWFTGSTTDPQCDENGSYISLDLDLNNLSGTIPSELVLLSNLVRLDFSRVGSAGALYGTIPSQLGVLNKLEWISLRGNELTGTIPTGIARLVNAASLDLSANFLVGIIPTEIGSMQSLTSLNLQSNGLNGMLPTTIGLLTHLRSLQLNGNELTGSIPTELGNNILLDYVALDQNAFTSLPTELGELILLRQFSAMDNSLQGPIPSEFGKLKLVLSLQLGNNSLTGTIPTEIGDMVELRDGLDLSNNALSGSLPTELGKLIFLRNLLLNNNLLTGSIPDSFASLSRLSELRLDSNNLSGEVSDAVCDVYSSSYPVFVTDCAAPEIVCSCCLFCCEDQGDCTCQYSGTDLDFLCGDFDRSRTL